MSLKSDFRNRKFSHTNRSSCIFPLDIKNGSDFSIAFLNYWKLKNKMNSLKLSLILFNNEGKKCYHFNKKIIDYRYDIRVSKLIKENVFKGMIEINFLSKKNLKFSYPGISGFYISPKKYISSVHASGRITDSIERNKFEKFSQETNFVLKNYKNIKPFFSLFNPGFKKKNNSIMIKIKSANNKTIGKKIIFNELKKPFQNKIFYLNDYFSLKKLKQSSFCVVKTSSTGVFPRMVCGNYNEKMHHYEVTHSFPVQNKKDFINNSYLKNKKVNHLALLPFIKRKNHELKLRVFPTNNKSNLKAKLFVYNKKNKNVDYKKYYMIKTGNENFEYVVKKNYEYGFFSVYQKNVPSRINTSYIYTNRNNGKYSTDTAAGFKSIDYPIKNTHWGTFLYNQNVNCEILIRRVNHWQTSENTIGLLTFYGEDFKKSIKIKLNPTDYKIILFSNIHKSKNKELKSCSWIAKFINGTGVEIFWNGFSKNFIYGDHSF